jgi:gamma-glutamyl:cysteine ligase YbdK (ATP-grasp superfamily)
MRPHPSFGTLEFRICDVPTRPRDTIAIAALAQAIVVKLYRLRSRNLGFRTYRRALIEENKWRAARWGLSGSLIDFGRRAECRCGGWRSSCSSSSTTSGRPGEPSRGRAPARDCAGRHQRRPAARDLRKKGDLAEVVRALVDETRESVEQSAKTPERQLSSR